MPGTAKPARRRQSCSCCGQQGHNRQSCETRPRDELYGISAKTAAAATAVRAQRAARAAEAARDEDGDVAFPRLPARQGPLAWQGQPTDPQQLEVQPPRDAAAVRASPGLPAPDEDSDDEALAVQDAQAGPGPGPGKAKHASRRYGCSYCGQQGHNRRSCQTRRRDLADGFSAQTAVAAAAMRAAAEREQQPGAAEMPADEGSDDDDFLPSRSAFAATWRQTSSP